MRKCLTLMSLAVFGYALTAQAQPGYRRVELNRNLYDLTISDDGRLLGLIDSTTAVVFPLDEDRQVIEFPGPSDYLRSIAFSRDNQLLACANRRSEVVIWDIASREKRIVLAPHKYGAVSLAFLPKSGLLAAGCASGDILFWDVTAQRVVKQLKPDPYRIPDLLVPTHDGKFLAARCDRPGDMADVWVWNLQTGERAAFIEYPGTEVEREQLLTRVTFSPDGKTLAVAGQTPDELRLFIHLWDTQTWKQTRTIDAGRGDINGFRFDKSDRVLAVSGNQWNNLRDRTDRERILRFLDVETGKEVARIPGLDGSLEFSPDGKKLYVIDKRDVVVYDTQELLSK